MTYKNNRIIGIYLKTAGLLGALGIALGAFGAHGLEELFSQNGKKDLWEKATQYQFHHVISLILLSSLTCHNLISNRAGKWIAVLWLTGILTFSGSLYGLAVGVNKSIGWVTPFGGLSFIAGWLILFASIKK